MGKSAVAIDTGEVVNYLEARLQRLEEARIDNSVQLARQTEILTSLGASFSSLCSDLKEHNSKIGAFLEKLETKMDQTSSRVEALERGDREKAKTRTWIRKLLFVAITGGGGAVGTVLLKMLWMK